jgi:hypothetical protein
LPKSARVAVKNMILSFGLAIGMVIADSPT